VERNHRAATMLNSNRHPSVWLEVMVDPLPAPSAVHRLTIVASELVIEGESHCQGEKPAIA
jgi:hypothetical protein